jgi:kumamolisin
VVHPKIQSANRPAIVPFAMARRFLFFIAAVFCTSVAWTQTARVQHPGSIREITATPNASITRTTLTPEETAAPMDFEVVLKMRNFPELQGRVMRGQLVARAEMDAKFHPVAADYQAVLAWLKGEGFTITREDPSRIAIFARGTVGQVGQALQATFARVSFRGKEYSSAVSAPQLPAEISGVVLGVNGLQPHLSPQPHSRQIQANPLSTTGNGPPFLPSQIMTAYSAAGVTATGAGQTIGIVINTFPKNSDLTTFWTTCGVSQSLSNIQEVQVVSGTLAAPAGEETLDTEWSSSIAPGAKVRIYATYDLGFAHLDQAYSQIYSDVSGTTPAQPTLHQVSLSFGLGEIYNTTSQMQTDEQWFANLASAGVTVFVSSGDGGSNPTSSGNSGGSTPTPESPASSYSVTAVGGTSITVNSTTGAEVTETVWSGSGGGISAVFTRPSWQTGTGVPSGSTRVVPDVAAPADPNTGALVVLNGVNAQYGGTSWGAPTWAGFCAIINQARAANGLAPLGLLGPKIYPLLGTGAFRDITSGSNGTYSAGTGYDLCTGIGVPNIAALVQTLSSAPYVATQPATQSVATGQSATFTISAGGVATLTYQWQREPAGTSTWASLTDNATYTGSTTASLTVANTTTGMTGDQFRCVVTNGFGSATSGSAALLVGVQAAPLVVSTFAGVAGTAGSTNGTGTAALFNTPGGICVDGSGNVYVADTGNQTIRKVTPAGVVSLYAGTAGSAGSSNTGTGTFNSPSNVAVDSSGNVYVADASNNAIRKITPAKVVSTLAGRAGRTGSTNGTGSGARFNSPQGVAVDSNGNIYVADAGNNLIRKVTSAGVTTTLAGGAGVSGSTDGSGTAARFNYPVDVAVDGSGNVYVADTNNNTIRKITPAGVVTTIAGTAGVTGSNDGLGTGASFHSPSGVRLDNASNIYIADWGNQTIRLLAPSGIVTTIAGTAGTSGSTNGIGAAALFYNPSNAAPDGNGNVYIIDSNNDTLRLGTFASAPVIQLQPSSLAIAAGLNTTFTVSASGNPAPTYQWQRFPADGSAWANLTDGSIYSGSATGTLTITGTTVGMNGDQFQCGATNAVGSATSASFALAVGIPPQITSLGSATFMLGQPGSFTLVATGTPAPAFSVTGLPPWASFNAATGTLTGTPPNGLGAPFTIGITAANGFSPATTQQFTLAVQSTFTLWQNLNFGTNAGTPSIAGSLADPAGDGISNLLKYALGANPLVPSAQALPVPALAIDPNDSLPHLTLTVSLDASATGITVSPQVSSDFITWQSGAGFTEIASDSTVNGIRTVTYRDTTPSGANAPQRFIRLQVTSP